MKIVTLIENLVYKQGLRAEHGLSFYIETAQKKILFDTGQSDGFIRNAEKLGIDLTLVDMVIISHGHYDHTGGLYPFLRMNQKAVVYIKKEAFIPKFHATKFIGIHYDEYMLDGRIQFVSDTLEIEKGVYIVPEIPLKNAQDTHFDDFFIQTGTHRIRDEFQDELFLSLVVEKKIIIISSCSHRGITNIIEAGVTRFGLPVHTVLGGFHIRNSGKEQLESVKLYLEQSALRSMGICHCTGVEPYAEFRNHFGDKVFYCHTGTITEIV